MASETTQRKLHYGWIVFIGACLMMIPQALPMNTAAIFYTPVTKALGISLSSFALNISIEQIAIFLSIATLTRWFNKYNIKIYMSVTIIVEALCFFAYSLAGNIWVFYIASFFNGCCVGILVYLVVPVLVNNWFAKRVATFIGIGSAIQGLAGAVFSYLGGLIMTSSDWRTCYVIWGIIVLVIGLPVSLFMLCKNPSDKGLMPIGYDAGSAVGTKAVLYGMDSKKAKKTSAYFMLILTQCLFAISIMFNPYLNTYTQSLGLAATVTAVVSALVMVGMMLGKIIVGAIADKSIGAAYTFGCVCAIFALPVIALLAGSNPAVITGCSLLFGISYATATVLGAATTRDIFGPRDYASNWALVGGLTSLLGAFGTTVWGYIIDGTGSISGIGYTNALLLAAALFTATLICSLITIRLGAAVKTQWTDAEGKSMPTENL